ncbi:hypothetical protein BDR05DRAFT_893963, partial [Suillus weaverae]
RTCSVCPKDGVYRCHSCMGKPLFCTHCCRTVHSSMPFHRISQWTGGFSWFWSIDVEGDSTSNDWMNECMLIAYAPVHILC